MATPTLAVFDQIWDCFDIEKRSAKLEERAFSKKI